MTLSIPARLAAGLIAVFCASSALAQSASRTRLFSTPNPSQSGQSVALTAEVDGLGGGAPTGDVVFKDGATTLGSGALAAPGAGQQTLAAGNIFGCALNGAGGAQCWGFNGGGRLGDGTTITRNTPVAVIGLATGVVAVATGDFHACALTGAGAVLCWGNNGQGQLGNPTAVAFSSTPVPVVGLSSGVVAIFAGFQHSCAVTSAGAVLCWGNNNVGQLGDGTTTSRPTPTPVVGLSSGVVAGAAGFAHSCALTGAGAVRCWGSNSSGRLGDGTETDRLTPVAVASLGSAAFAITAGSAHTCAITGSGAAFCWGSNAFGQLGDGTTTNRLIPVVVSGLAAGTAAIVAGATHTCALRTTGAALCWGDNGNGQLGDGTQTSRLEPTAVSGLANGRIAIAAGANHSCALGSNGALQCWGFNSAGQIGDGTFTQRLTPTDVVNFAGLTRARARLSSTAISVGFRELTAAFPGNAAHSASTSPVLRQLVNPAAGLATTTALSASPNPSTARQPVTFTATVRSNFGVTSGFVDFVQDGTRVGSAPLDENGVAVFAATPSPVGSREWRAEYAPQAGFTGSFATLEQVVNPLATQMSLTASPDPSPFGRPVTIAATVSSPAGPVTGEVSFFLDDAPFATAPLSGGTASVTATPPLGRRFWRAEFAQQGDFAAAAAAVNHVVEKGTTTTRLGVSPGASVFSQPVTLTARVFATGGPAQGVVRFFEDGAFAGLAFLANGVARVFTNSGSPGSRNFTAVYEGDPNFLGSTSPPVAHTVGKASARLTLSAASSNVNPTQRVKLTLRGEPVPPAQLSPFGDVDVTQNGALLDNVQISGSDDREILTARLPFGQFRFGARFLGSTDFNAADAAPVDVTVDFRLGVETLVNRITAGPQSNPAVAHGVNGEALAVWESATDAGQPKSIQSRRILADGRLAPLEIGVAAAAAGVGAPQTTGLSNGDYAVVWQADAGTNGDVFMRLMKADGTARTLPVRVNTRTIDKQQTPVVAGLNGGGFVVAFQSRGEDGSGEGVLAQRYSNAGAKVGGPIPVNTTTAGDQTTPAIATLTGGGFVVAWAGPVAGGFSAFFQRFDASGAAVGAETRVDPVAMTANPKLALATLAANAFIVSWDEPETDAASPRDVFARRYDGGGAPDGVIFRVNLTTAGPQADPAATLLDLGRSHVVAWTTPDANLTGVAAQVFSPTGARIETPFPVNTRQSSWTRAPALAPLGRGTAAGSTYVILWWALTADPSQGGILMQRFLAP